MGTQPIYRKKLARRIALVLLGLSLAVILLPAGIFQLVNRTNGALVSSGEKRTYLLYVPEKYDPATPAPLVISIHGFAEWPAHQRDISHWNTLADQHGLIVVYPSGTNFPLRWQITPGSSSDPHAMVDAIFISDLIDKLSTEYTIDAARIYANGLSNGGGMSYLLSCSLSERIAAFGSVSGAYLLPWEACNPTRQVPAIIFHGTADSIVPYQGGPSQAFNIPFPSIPEWIDILATKNGCDKNPQEVVAGDDIRSFQFTGCDAEVVFYSINGGGHSWPGGVPMPEAIVGYTTQEIDATQLMWDFFQRHPLTER